MKKSTQLILSFYLLISASCSSDGNQSNVGLNSSYSGMITVGSFLYQVDPSNITTYDISDATNPVEVNKQNLGFEIETIYHFGGVLFVGSARALFIFEIGENGVPVPKSETSYDTFQADQTPCDPVISDGSYAYVTLATTTSNPTNPCFRPEPFNKLLIYDIANLSNPTLVAEREMEEPKGLSKDGNYLFVCDGTNGLKIFDASDVENLIEIYHISGQNTRDAIAKDELLIVVGQSELRQYDYSNINAIVELGRLDL